MKIRQNCYQKEPDPRRGKRLAWRHPWGGLLSFTVNLFPETPNQSNTGCGHQGKIDVPLPPVSTMVRLSVKSLSVPGVWCQALSRGRWPSIHLPHWALGKPSGGQWAPGNTGCVELKKTFIAEEVWARGRLLENAGIEGEQNAQRNLEQSILQITSDGADEINHSSVFSYDYKSKWNKVE